MKVKAPKGYHWMKQKNGSFKLMKHTGNLFHIKELAYLLALIYKKDTQSNGKEERSKISKSWCIRLQ